MVPGPRPGLRYSLWFTPVRIQDAHVRGHQLTEGLFVWVCVPLPGNLRTGEENSLMHHHKCIQISGILIKMIQEVWGEILYF